MQIEVQCSCIMETLFVSGTFLFFKEVGLKLLTRFQVFHLVRTSALSTSVEIGSHLKLLSRG